MLQLSQSFANCPIVSLRTGGKVGQVVSLIINPTNFRIEGMYCEDMLNRKKTVVLLTQDIREAIPQGLVIDDHDALTDPAELVRLKPIMDLNFRVIDKPVYTESKAKLGKVSDIAINTSTMLIQKLYVTQPVLKSLTSGPLIIDRSQIVNVTDNRITVQDLSEKLPAAAQAIA